MLLKEPKTPLVLAEVPMPKTEKGQILIRITACAICRTDLHILDNELKDPKLPLIMGHQIVGVVESDGHRFKKGDRVGVPWLGKSCGRCFYCKSERENLCDDPLFTGYNLNGGYAEYCVANEAFAFSLPENYSDTQVAPLLCAGMIGYRSLKMAGEAKKIGYFGFGSAAHLLIQVSGHLGQEVYAFTRPGDEQGIEEAKKRGAVWAKGSDEQAPDLLDAAIIFAPVGSLVPTALKAVRKGGSVICGGIHMSDIPSFPYEILWGERVLRSVANLTRKDGEEFLALAPKIPIKTEVTTYSLEKANEALSDLKEGNISGAAVLIP